MDSDQHVINLNLHPPLMERARQVINRILRSHVLS